MAELDRIRDRLARLGAGAPARDTSRKSSADVSVPAPSEPAPASQAPATSRAQVETVRQGAEAPAFAAATRSVSMHAAAPSNETVAQPVAARQIPATAVSPARVADGPVPQGAGPAPAVASREVEMLRGELGEMKQILAELVRRDPSGQVSADLQRISRELDTVRNAPVDASHLEEIASELQAIRQEMRQDRPVVRDDLMRSIEEGYSAISELLRHNLERPAAPAPVTPEILALGDQVAQMRDILGAMPWNRSIDQIEARLEELARGFVELSNQDEELLSRHIAGIEGKLDDLARAVVAASAVPMADKDAMDRIEARLNSLSKAVDEITSGAIQELGSGVAEAAAQALEVVTAQIIDLSSRVEQIYELASAQGADEGELAGLLTQLDGIERRLGEMSQTQQAYVNDRSAFESIERQIVEFADRLDGFGRSIMASVPAAAIGRDNEILDAIQTLSKRLFAASTAPGVADSVVLASIGERIDQVTAQLASIEARQPTMHRDDIEARHAQLLASIDQISARLSAIEPALAPDGDRLASMEQSLDRIVSQLGTGRREPDLGFLTERLDNIEQQVMISRDFAVEAANQAAERVLRMAGQISAQSQGGLQPADPALVTSISAELQGLEALARDLSARSDEGFAAVRDVLDNVMARLDEIENGMRDGDVGRDLHDAPPGSAFASMPERSRSSASLDALTAGGYGDRDPAESRNQSRAEEDVPLEPGSGVPDLAALVRDASERRRMQAAEANGTLSGGDLLAQARRAAQQSAAGNPAGRDKAAVQAPAQKPGSAKAGGIARFGSLLAAKKRALLAAAAIAAIIGVGVPVGMRLLSAGEEPQSLSRTDLPVEPLSGAPAASADGPAQSAEAANGPARGLDVPLATEILDEPASDLTAAQSAPSGMAQGSETADNGPAAISTDGMAQPMSGKSGPDADQDTLTAGLAAPEAAGEPSGQPGDAITSAPIPPEEAGNAALRQAAANGNAEALFEIARRYTDGDAVERDLAKAAQWYEEAARAGSAPAQYRLANFFEKGYGVKADVERAALWYQRSAEQGNALAMHNLGVLFVSGALGGKQNFEQALGWFTKAADLGVKDSQVNLGIIYAQGMGVEADNQQAYKWLSIASRGGDTEAGSMRDSLAAKMAADDVTKARALAEAWKPGVLDPEANVSSVLPEWKDGTARKAQANSPDMASAAPSQRDVVALVQARLAEMGYDPGPADGVMGARTREAVRAVQKSLGMAANGEITRELLERLSGPA